MKVTRQKADEAVITIMYSNRQATKLDMLIYPPNFQPYYHNCNLDLKLASNKEYKEKKRELEHERKS